MYSFLVLGLIPGTDIAISFNTWLILAALLVVISLRPRRARPQTSTRQPLPASSLHRRFI